MNGMKILIVCQFYYPEQFRITDICETLVKKGNEVTVLTGLPNYPKGHIEKGESEMSYEKMLLLLRTYAADANELFDVQHIDKLLEEHKLFKKEEAKRNIGKSSLGHTIDTYMQGMQYGQTNGIPQGGALFDFIAEIVLGYADKLLVERLKEEQIEDYKILRYRDDYRIFSNNKDELEKISIILQTVLADLNFNMNASKTILTDSIVENAIKPDKYFYISNIPAYKKEQSLFASFQKELLYILSIAKQYPNSGTTCMLMTNISKRIQDDATIYENIHVLIAIVIDIAINSPKIYQQALACISNLINRIEDEEIKINLIKDVYNKLSALPNIGHIQIWMQRITIPLDKKYGNNPYSETLCKIIYGDHNELWNLEWLKPDLCVDLPIDKICDNKVLGEMVPYIKIEEVDVFGYQ